MKTNVCLKGFKKDKNGKCRKVILPKKATVCLSGYKISKNGKCVKDINYAIIVSSSEKRKTPILPNICLEGYKFSDKDGKCKKIKLGLSTVCKEGYKVTKNGKCIKDKNYTTVFASTKIADIPSPSVNSAIANSSPVKLLKAETAEQVKEILKENNITIPVKAAKDIADAKTPAQMMSIFNSKNFAAAGAAIAGAYDFVNSGKLIEYDQVKEIIQVMRALNINVPPDILTQLALATRPSDIIKIMKNIPEGEKILSSLKLLEAETPKEVNVILKQKNLTVPPPIEKKIADAKTPEQMEKVFNGSYFSGPFEFLKALFLSLFGVNKRGSYTSPPPKLVSNLVDADTPAKVEKVLDNSKPDLLPRPSPQAIAKIAESSSPDYIKELVTLGTNQLPPSYAEVVSNLSNAVSTKDVSKIFNSIPIPQPPPGATIQKLVDASTVNKVENILNKNGLTDAIKSKIFNSPIDELKERGFKLKSSLDRVLNAKPVKDNSKLKDTIVEPKKTILDEIKERGQARLNAQLANTETVNEVKEILKDNDIKKAEPIVEELVKADTEKKVEQIMNNSDLVESVGAVIPVTPEITSAISKASPEDLKLIESETYIKKVFKEHGVEYTGCSSLNEVLQKFRTKCIKAIGYSTNLPQDKCVERHVKLIDIRYPSFKKHLGIVGCIIDDKLIKSFA